MRVGGGLAVLVLSALRWRWTLRSCAAAQTGTAPDGNSAASDKYAVLGRPEHLRVPRPRQKAADRTRDGSAWGSSPGKSVADIGAGSGWFTLRAAQRVGTCGHRVFAEDINPKAIDDDQRPREPKEKHGKCPQRSWAHRTITKLPPKSVDAVLLLKVYHEIAHPVPVMQAAESIAAKPGAKVGIIDRNGNGTDHGLDRARFSSEEMGEAGYRVEGRYDFTKGRRSGLLSDLHGALKRRVAAAWPKSQRVQGKIAAFVYAAIACAKVCACTFVHGR